MRLGWEFADGDDYHPAANIEKMRNGVHRGCASSFLTNEPAPLR
jgi:hypothetical protein